jgi:hypothetical protein
MEAIQKVKIRKNIFGLVITPLAQLIFDVLQKLNVELFSKIIRVTTLFKDIFVLSLFITIFFTMLFFLQNKEEKRLAKQSCLHVGRFFLTPSPKTPQNPRCISVHIKILLFWSLFVLFSSNFLQNHVLPVLKES